MGSPQIDEGQVNKIVLPPPPIVPLPVVRQTPPVDTSGNNGAATKANEFLFRGAMNRQSLEDKQLTLVGPTVAGTIAGSRAPTSTAEAVGFAPRTKESATAARSVADTINKYIDNGGISRKYTQENPVVGVGIHKDGSLTVTFSGGAKGTQNLYNKTINDPTVPGGKQTLQAAIQQDLNRTFAGNNNIKRDGNGNVEFRFGQAETALKLNPATKRGENNVIQDAPGSSNKCAAGKSYQGQSTTETNPIVAADEVWRPRGNDALQNRHPDKIKINNTDNRSMSPCERCTTNSDLLIENGYKPAGITAPSAARTGATGAGVAAVTSTLEQLWNTGHVDAGKLATDTALGVPTAIAGEAVERAVTPGATRAAQSVVSRFGSQALTTAESKAVSATFGRLGGAGAAGGLISAGFEAYHQGANLIDPNKHPEAIGAVVGQAAVGVAAGVAGAQIGAMIGTAIPIPGVGTVAGAVIGFGVGYALSATGADKAIANGVSSTIRGVESAASDVKNAVANFFGW